ncbi:hypothetical protein JCM5353_003983 [Sporobolomyces roseus]
MTTSSPLASTSYYKRPLPSTCLPFNSPEGRRIFANLQQDDLDAYFLLSQHFLTQNEPAYCALGTLAMILNSLEMDPQRIWKGNWRWYSENLLDCCRPLEEVAQVGLTLPEFACLARCNGLSARVVSPSLVETDRKTALEEFRRDLKKATRAEEIMAISYSRKVLGQTGTGHFSPVGAYSPSDDKLLVLDVARFKYPSYWISVELAYDSLVPIDDATGQPRGYVMLKPAPKEMVGSLTGKQSLTSLTLNKSSWALLSNTLSRILLETPKTSTLETLLERVVSHLSNLPTPAVITRPLPDHTGPTSESPAPSRPTSPSPGASDELLSKLATSSVPGSSSNPLITLLILSLFSPRSPLTALVPPHLAKDLRETISIDSTIINDEIDFLASQLGALGECCRAEEEGAGCGCATKGTISVDKDDSITDRQKCH